MSVLTVTAKGQVTLRRELLRHLGVRPGDRISVEMLPEGRIEIEAAQPAGRISDIFDALKRKAGPALPLQEIARIAARGWAGKR